MTVTFTDRDYTTWEEPNVKTITHIGNDTGMTIKVTRIDGVEFTFYGIVDIEV